MRFDFERFELTTRKTIRCSNQQLFPLVRLAEAYSKTFAMGFHATALFFPLRFANNSGRASCKNMSRASGIPSSRHWETACGDTRQSSAVATVPPMPSMIWFASMWRILGTFKSARQVRLQKYLDKGFKCAYSSRISRTPRTQGTQHGPPPKHLAPDRSLRHSDGVGGLAAWLAEAGDVRLVLGGEIYRSNTMKRKASTPSTAAPINLASLLAKLPMMLQMQDAAAQVTRAKYLALIKSGFTEQQAIELCK